MYDKEGMPLLINRDYDPYNELVLPNYIYSYAQNKIISKTEKITNSNITIADINGDGRKEIISFVPSKYNSSNTQLTEEDGAIDESGTDWTQVTAKISVNKPGTLLFPLPKTLTAGTYRIVLKTRCTSNLKYKRKELITTVSNVIKIQ